MNVLIDGRPQPFRAVSFDAQLNAVVLIEQRLLPHRFVTVATSDFRQTARAIADMVVRGAPAIAATAAYGLAQGACAFHGQSLPEFTRHVELVCQTLRDARPTAVDPLNAMNAVRAAMRSGTSVAERQALALAAAEEFANNSVAQCRAIGRHGAPLIAECAAWLECRASSHQRYGDHVLFIGEVEKAAATEARPLLYLRGRYAFAGERAA